MTRVNETTTYFPSALETVAQEGPQPSAAKEPVEPPKAQGDVDSMETIKSSPASAKAEAGAIPAWLAGKLKNEGDQITVALGVDGKINSAIGVEGERKATLTRTRDGYEMALAEKAGASASVKDSGVKAGGSIAGEQTSVYAFSDPTDLAWGLAAAGGNAYIESLGVTKPLAAAANALDVGTYGFLNEHCVAVELSGTAAAKAGFSVELAKIEGMAVGGSTDGSLKTSVRIEFGHAARGDKQAEPARVTIKAQAKAKLAVNGGVLKQEGAASVTASQTLRLTKPIVKGDVLKGDLPSVDKREDVKLTFSVEGQERNALFGIGETSGGKKSITVSSSALGKASQLGSEAIVKAFVQGDSKPLMEALKDSKVEVETETSKRSGLEGKYGAGDVSVAAEISRKEVHKSKETLTAADLMRRFTL